MSVEAGLAGASQRFVIEAQSKPVGVLGVSNIVEGAFRSANLGYWVAQDHNRRGIATQAVKLAVRWAFDERGLHRLEAGTLVDNLASQRVLERNRFTRVGLSPRYLRIDGEWRDHILFARTVEDLRLGDRAGQAARTCSSVRLRCSGITRTSASTGMKLVSPPQRGTRCRCR